MGFLVALLQAGVSGAQVPESVPDAGLQQDVVCLLLPLTGPHAVLGSRVASAVDRVFEEDGTEMHLLRFDTSGTVTGAAAAVSKAVAAGCILAIGGLGDREAIAVAEAAESEGLPTINLGLVPDSLTRRHVIWSRTPRDVPIKALVGHLIAVRGEARASLLFPETAYGRKVANAFSAAFQALGGRLRVERSFNRTDELKTVAEGFAGDWKKGDEEADCVAEVVFVGADLGTARRLVPFLRYQEAFDRSDDRDCPPVTVAGTALWNEPALIAQGGDELQGGLFADLTGDGEPEGRSNSEALEEETREAAGLVLTVLGSARAPGTEGVVDLFQSGLTWKGAAGELRLERGRVAGRKVVVFTIDRGVLKPVGGM